MLQKAKSKIVLQEAMLFTKVEGAKVVQTQAFGTLWNACVGAFRIRPWCESRKRPRIWRKDARTDIAEKWQSLLESNLNIINVF